jgi:hypothetical protein
MKKLGAVTVGQTVLPKTSKLSTLCGRNYVIGTIMMVTQKFLQDVIMITQTDLEISTPEFVLPLNPHKILFTAEICGR